MSSSAQTLPAPAWDIESIFSGGSQSKEFENFRLSLKRNLEEAKPMLENLPSGIRRASLAEWVRLVLKLQALYEDIELVMSFANCLISQNVDDTKAHTVVGEGDIFHAEWKKLRAGLEARSLKVSDAEWQLLVSDPQIGDAAFYLSELRALAKSRMAVELEALALELSVNGYHAWNRLYDKMAGDLRVEFEEDGTVKTLSLGQLATKLSHSDRQIRRRAFEKLVSAWESRADLAAMALNAQGGFRLSLYGQRGWPSPLYEPLTMSRMQEGTLETMWRVVARETPRLKAYIDAKKRLLKIDKFSWFDEFAPCGKMDRGYPFEEASRFITDNIKPFSKDFAAFVDMALTQRWVEAEDRPGKAAGGFCTGTGPLRQSRIFMTYAGTFDGLLTLAHELGHAYHSWVLKDKPFFATQYPHNLAETASIFAELLVVDAALTQTTDKDEKLLLLDQKLQAAYTQFCDIRCRFLFDQAFYAERRGGIVPKERLNELMIEAQKKAFAGMLDDSGYHPLFWCSKLHFYLTEVPFYNFPYAFGYLFSAGVYQRARREGPAFANKYRALLADTGCMTTEELARRHLGVDLTQEDFWIDAVNVQLAEVETFVKLAANQAVKNVARV
ncbi:MAG TPA: M3 family oligoendopeptidase [Candidatus Deferrimicrobium sp.]|nr:M3 family oligoendopeptidase [Candidatus Deferrimicrobium sp.]